MYPQRNTAFMMTRAQNFRQTFTLGLINLGVPNRLCQRPKNVFSTSMDLTALTLALSLGWAAIHALYYLLRRSRLRLRPLLPAAFPGGRHGYFSVIQPPLPITIVLKYLHLRVETTSWNSKHDDLTVTLRRRRNSSTPKLKLFYNFGIVLCLLGIAGSVATLIWTCWELNASLWRRSLVSGLSANALIKRSLEDTSEPSGGGKVDTPFLKPIVSTVLLFRILLSERRCKPGFRDK